MNIFFKVVIFSLLMAGANYAFADDYSIVCYGVKNNKKSFSVPCVLERSFTQGHESSIYSFNNKVYEVLINGNVAPQVTRLNSKPAKHYYRGYFFEKVNYGGDIYYECYQSATTHFCAQRAGYGNK